MELFAFISLLLSVFGAALASISGLRNHYDKFLATILEDVGSKLDIIADRGSGSVDLSNEKADLIRGWHKKWIISHWVPVALFSILTFVIILYVCLFAKFDPNTQLLIESKVPMVLMRWVLGPFFLLNVGCFCLALFSVAKIKAYAKVLDEYVVVAKEPAGKQVVKAASKGKVK